MSSVDAIGFSFIVRRNYSPCYCLHSVYIGTLALSVVMILCFIQLLALHLASADPPYCCCQELCNFLSMTLLGVIDFLNMSLSTYCVCLCLWWQTSFPSRESQSEISSILSSQFPLLFASGLCSGLSRQRAFDYFPKNPGGPCLKRV